MAPDPDDIADCVLAAFDALPAKRKPRERDAATREWIPLAGIVLSISSTAQPYLPEDGALSLTCAALGTGMKCLPASKIHSANGAILHDWHAEVLALRAFNRFLLDECAHLLARGHRDSEFVRLRAEEELSPAEPQPFAIRDDVEIYMYCSEAPCGDASMELIMEAQDDATPWTLPPKAAPGTPGEEEAEFTLRGRGYFSELGIVRRKPARPDALPTLSKSCTDKIALKQCTSLLSSTASLLLSPKTAYLQTLILPESQHVPVATARAFSPSGRMSGLTQETTRAWSNGYIFHPFDVQSTSREFKWSRRSGQPEQMLIPCNISALYTPYHQETLINGILQGRKQGDLKGASVVSRRAMWKTAVDVVVMAKDALPLLPESLSELVGKKQDYECLKRSRLLGERERVKGESKKTVLLGWAKNAGDDGFGIEDNTQAETPKV